MRIVLNLLLKRNIKCLERFVDEVLVGNLYFMILA